MLGMIRRSFIHMSSSRAYVYITVHIIAQVLFSAYIKWAI